MTPVPPRSTLDDVNAQVAIIGGGTGGTVIANRLHRSLGAGADITVLDRDDAHLYQPGLLFVPFGSADPQRIVRSRRAQLRDGVTFRLGEAETVDTAHDTVRLRDGSTLGYDVLVIAGGARLVAEETDGLTKAMQGERVFTFYDRPGAVGLRDALRSLRRGRLVVNVVDNPIKCPVAPLEFCFLADWWLRRSGRRADVELVYVTPLDGAFTRPVAADRLGRLLEAKGIELVTEFATAAVDGDAGSLVSWDGRAESFDLLVTIPAHSGPGFVERSRGLGDELGFVTTDPATMRARAAENVFVIGDAANVPTSKAGSVAHFQADTVAENVGRQLGGRPLLAGYDGHANCFVETGFGRALLIDFNYEIEPLPGRFPEPHVGPLTLLGESRLNHLAKLAFERIYWHILLPGRPTPGISSRLQLAGKDLSLLTPADAVPQPDGALT